MDTVTCQSCWAEIKGDNVGAHFEWHEKLDADLTTARSEARGVEGEELTPEE